MNFILFLAFISNCKGSPESHRLFGAAVSEISARVIVNLGSGDKRSIRVDLGK
jgi:hypothetical protein